MQQTAGMRWVAALVLVLALAGCKSGKSSPATTTPTSGTATSAPSASCVLPQNNGGDHDADNNGGPDDGDGCDK